MAATSERLVVRALWATALLLGLTAAVEAALVREPTRVSIPSPFAGCSTREAFTNAEVEPALAADPRNRNRLIAVYQQDRYHGRGARGIVAAASTDGGLSWSHVALPVSSCAVHKGTMTARPNCASIGPSFGCGGTVS